MPETAKQVTVYLENKPGRLATVCTALSDQKVNITAVTVGESRDRSVLRMVTDDLPKTRQVLKQLNVPFEEQDVVLVEMRNQPGALAHVCELLAGEHINIDYAYCSAGTRNGKTIGIFKVSNLPKCLKVLAETPGTRLKREAHGGRGWVRGTKGRPVPKGEA
ncbi:MAG: ACT domain-containing protein [Gemmatales bacterium]|nr:ACT domain-containing protein [Gemmatales bacterium]MDW8386656.1 ACT domain-containing protein [Gemmatales bacterium]